MSRQPNGGFIGKENITDNTQASGIYTLSDVARKVADNEFPPARYTPSRSLRFRSSANTYLRRTPSVVGNRKTFTISVWFKISFISSTIIITEASDSGGTTVRSPFRIQSGGGLQFSDSASGADYITSMLFRDPSAWYHAIVAVDTTQAIATERIKIYINGVRQTSFATSTAPTLNADTLYNSPSYMQNIGSGVYWTAQAFDGYMAEFNQIDGQALTPSSFGEYEARTGEWKPKRYTGTYGTNGFYLPFSNNSGLDQLGRDYGNGGSEFVTNGFFDANVTGWSVWPGVSGSPFITWQSTGKARIGNTQNNGTIYYQAITTEIGKTYYATASVSNISIGANGRTCALQWASSLGGVATTIASIAQPNSGTISGSFVATSTTSYILLNVDVLGTGTQGADWDSISVSDTSIKNHWNANNFSLTAGANYDSMTDVPGVGAPVTNDIGGVTRGNYATLNALHNPAGVNLFDGNLRATTAISHSTVNSTIGVTSGKWYAEFPLIARTDTCGLGVTSVETPFTGYPGNFAGGWWVYNNSSQLILQSPTTGTGAGSTMAAGQIWHIALDMDNGKVWFGYNGSWYGNASTVSLGTGNPSLGINATFEGIPNTSPVFMFLQNVNCTWGANFGQRPFSYTPPTGFKSLCTTNLPEPTIKRPQEHFDVKLYTGNGISQTIGNTARKTDNLQISRSLRFNAAEATNYLTRTLGTPTSSQKFTYSTWIKRASLGSAQFVLQAGNASNVETQWYFLPSTDQIRFYDYDGTHRYDITTVLAFKDTSSWFHLVVQYDSTQANSADRFKVYINGVSISLTTTVAVTQNATNSRLNSAVSHDIGGSNIEARWFDGYLAEINFVDGQSLTAESFGSFDVDGSWQAKSYTGTYGNNGFRLTFSDNSNTTATTLGKDAAGSNDFTPNGFTVTAGTGNDSFVDVPTNWGGDGVDSGGEIRGFYPILGAYQNSVTVSNGGLRFVCSNDATPRDTFATVKLNSGKWYWEAFKNNNCIRFYTGIIEDTGTPGNGYAAKVGYDTVNASNRTLMFAVDFTLGKYWSGKEGVWDSGNPALGTGGTLFVPSTGTGYWIPLAGGYAETPNPSADGFINFGQRPFTYTPPAGFSSINTKNLNEQYPFATGPDLVWIKNRGNASPNHSLMDTVRGALRRINSNSTNAESTNETGFPFFTSNGFNVATNDSAFNAASNTYVAWNWNAGNRTVGNQDGTITSTVRASKENGFSIVRYTGTGTAGSTVGHGLGITPKFIMTKRLDSTSNFWVYCQPQQAPYPGQWLYLNLNFVTQNTANASDAPYFKTNPSPSVFTIAGDGINTVNGSYISYVWAEIPGYSRIGSYTGNGNANGAFIYTGFRPAWIMIKRMDATNDWVIEDKSRIGYNVANYHLIANAATVEFTDIPIDFLSNGFKCRGSGGSHNASGGTYVFVAFADSPFKYALAR